MTFRLSRLFVSTAALAFSTAAYAQVPAADTAGTVTEAEAAAAEPDTAAAADPGYNDIIVTARRTEERLQDVPLAISAIGGDSLQSAGITNAQELSGAVPNLNVKTGNAEQGSAIFAIRGQSQTNVLLTVDNAVGVYQDNVNNPRAYGLLGAGLIDVQRVEVLRGPQGTLYGRNTTGGAVGIFTQDPKPDFGLSVQLTAGNYNYLDAVAIVNLPVSDNAGFRFVAQRGIHDPYANVVGPRRGLDDPKQEDSSYLRGKFKGTFGALQVSLTGDYYRNDMGGNAVSLAGLYDPTLFDSDPNNDGTNLGGNAVREVALELGLNPANPADLAIARQTLLSYVDRGGFYDTFTSSPLKSVNSGGSLAANVEFELSDSLTLRSISGYRKLKRETALDFDGTPFDIFVGNRFASSDRFVSQEVQLLGEIGPVSFVLGGYYSDEKGTEYSDQVNTRLISNGRRVFVNGTVTSKSYAAFAQANLQITDALRLTGGFRYTTEKKGLINRNSNSNGCTVAPELLDTPGVCAATFSDTFSDPSWLVSADYKVTDDILVYAKVARGFRGGGQNLRAAGTNVGIYQSFAPETVTEYELGIKADLFDRRFTFNLAAFYDDYKDAQRSVSILVNNNNTTLVTNAASATLKGFEIETRVRLGGGVSLNGSLGHLSPKYDEFIDLTGDRSNEVFPTPSWTYSIGADVVRPFSGGEFKGTLVYTGQSKQNGQPQAKLVAQNTQPAYGTLNGRIGVEFNALGAEVAFYAKNITKTKYYVAFVTLESIGYNIRQAGDPRTFGIQITKRFGGER